MKKMLLLLFCFCYLSSAWSQTELAPPFQEIWDNFSNHQQQTINGTEKVVDSIVFLRIDNSLQLSLEKREVFLYDSLAQETRLFSSSFDRNADTLLFTNQTNTTYPPNQIVASKGIIEQNQYQNTDRYTESFTTNEVLLSALEETWEPGTNSFVNTRLITNYFINSTDLVDSMITQLWDPGSQQWLPERLDLQFFGGDDLRDSVYSYQWNSSSNIWRLTGKLTAAYDPLGQLINLNVFEWDSSSNGFSLQLETFEFYNGDALKDSAHVYTYFGGYYGESATIFSYDNDLVIADTIYLWDAGQAQLKLANYQSYAYDSEGDLVEQRTYSYDAINDLATQVTQANYYYSTVETPSVAVQQLIPNEVNCQFANPYTIGSPIRCDLETPRSNLRMKVYTSTGQLLLDQALPQGESIHFAVEKELSAGLYLLSLEDSQGQIGRYKLLLAQ